MSRSILHYFILIVNKGGTVGQIFEKNSRMIFMRAKKLLMFRKQEIRRSPKQIWTNFPSEMQKMLTVRTLARNAGKFSQKKWLRTILSHLTPNNTNMCKYPKYKSGPETSVLRLHEEKSQLGLPSQNVLAKGYNKMWKYHVRFKMREQKLQKK